VGAQYWDREDRRSTNTGQVINMSRAWPIIHIGSGGFLLALLVEEQS